MGFQFGQNNSLAVCCCCQLIIETIKCELVVKGLSFFPFWLVASLGFHESSGKKTLEGTVNYHWQSNHITVHTHTRHPQPCMHFISAVKRWYLQWSRLSLSLSLSLSPLLCFITTGVRFACGVDVGSVGVCCGGSGGWWWSKANKNILWEIGLSSQTLIGPTILTHIVCSEYFYKIAIPTNSSIVCTDQTKHQNALCKQKCRKRCSKQ